MLRVKKGKRNVQGVPPITSHSPSQTPRGRGNRKKKKKKKKKKKQAQIEQTYEKH